MPIRRSLFALAVAACAAPDTNTLPGDAAPPPAGDFILETGNFVAGAPITLSVSRAPANSVVRFAYSLRGLGSGACPASFGGRCLSIAGQPTALALSVLTNGAGAGQLTVVLPTGAVAQNVAFQAASGVGANTRLSNPIARLVGNVGTVINPGVDLDGDGVLPSAGDCADFNPSIRPGAPDAAGDGIDANCDNLDGVDGDGDGWLAGSDCDDADAMVNPGMVESCDGRDEDCDGRIDVGAAGSACGRSDVFTVSAAAADVLVVVDNSGSMAEEQARVASASAAFIPPLLAANVDLHLGVVTTDMDDPTQAGRLVPVGGARYATAQTANLEAWFDAAINVGVNGSADEKGNAAVYAALTQPLVNGVNAGFYRTTADLHVIVVSDENDYSAVTPATFGSWLNLLKVGGADAWFHTLVAPIGGCATGDAGLNYLTVNSAVGGMVGSICDFTFTPFFDAVADEIVARAAADTFLLSEDPDPSTIEVSAQVPGVGLVLLAPNQWTYFAASRVLQITGWILPPGSVVTVNYDL